jgi:hypothetical protein
MPIVPVYESPQVQATPLQAPRLPLGGPSPWAGVAEGFQSVAEAIQKTQLAADTAETGRIKRETSAQMEAAVSDAYLKYSDPTEFSTAAKEAVSTIYDNRIGSASNARVQEGLRNNLGDDVIRLRSQIDVHAFKKTQDKANGDWITMRDQALKDYSATDDPVKQSEIAAELGSTLKTFQATNLFSAKEAKAEVSKLQELTSEMDVKKDFKKDPLGTIDKMDKGEYAQKLAPERLDILKSHFSEQYRLAQNDIKRKVADDQEKNFADALIQARKGQLNEAQVDGLAAGNPVTGERKIDATQYRQLIEQVQATAATGGVRYSDPALKGDMEYRARFGSLAPKEIQSAQRSGKLTLQDANAFYSTLDERIRRDRTDDPVTSDPNYKRASQYMTRALPSTDRLDLDHGYKIMVGQAFVDFDKAARATGPDGKPKYSTKDYQGIAENIVEGTLTKMDLQGNMARAKLLPGIKTPDDVANAVRNRTMTPDQAKEQIRLLLQLGITPSLTPQSGSRTQSAQDRAKALGAP